MKSHTFLSPETKGYITPANLIFGRNTTRLRQVIASILLFISLLNFLMIAIVNTSLLNPGPENIKVYYQNVQGLIGHVFF